MEGDDLTTAITSLVLQIDNAVNKVSEPIKNLLLVNNLLLVTNLLLLICQLFPFYSDEKR